MEYPSLTCTQSLVHFQERCLLAGGQFAIDDNLFMTNHIDIKKRKPSYQTIFLSILTSILQPLKKCLFFKTKYQIYINMFLVSVVSPVHTSCEFDVTNLQKTNSQELSCAQLLQSIRSENRVPTSKTHRFITQV